MDDPDISAQEKADSWNLYSGASSINFTKREDLNEIIAFPGFLSLPAVKSGTDDKIQVYKVYIRYAPSAKKAPASQAALLEIPAELFKSASDDK